MNKNREKEPPSLPPLIPLSQEAEAFVKRKMQKVYHKKGALGYWSKEVKRRFLSSIRKEFQKKFPQESLIHPSLQKLWNKIVDYSSQLKEQKLHAFHQGYINLAFLVKEGLKQYFSLHLQWESYSSAYQLALKITDCLSTVQEAKPSLTHLAKTIWCMQCHLSSKTKKPLPLPSSADPQLLDPWDRWIVNSLCNLLTHNPSMGWQDLEKKVELLAEETFHFFQVHRKEKQNSLKSLAWQASLSLNPSLPSALFFIEKERIDTKRSIEHSVECYFSALLKTIDPTLQPSLVDMYAQLWQKIQVLYQEQNTAPAIPLWMQEIAQDFYIENGSFSLGQIVEKLENYLEQLLQLFTPPLSPFLKNKISFWSCQQEMLLRWVTIKRTDFSLFYYQQVEAYAFSSELIPPSLPLLQEWVNKYISHFPQFVEKRDIILSKMHFLHKHHFYQRDLNPDFSDVERFLLQEIYKETNSTEKEAKKKIEVRFYERFPMLPLSEEAWSLCWSFKEQQIKRK